MCVFTCICEHVYGYPWGSKRALDPLKLELVVVNHFIWMLRAKFWFFAKTASALNC